MAEPKQTEIRRRPLTRLSGDAMDYLRAGGKEATYEDGAAVVTVGEPGRAFYVVVDGEVDVVLKDGSGRRLHLASLGSGASFGEMSLLTDDPVSADVIARGEATLLEFPGERFNDALTECESLRGHILARLTSNLRRTNTEAWAMFQRAEALSALVHLEGSSGEIVAHSPAMREVDKQITELAERLGPVLVTGEPGTGKLFAAKRIHEARGHDESPLIVVDCVRVAGTEMTNLLFGSAEEGSDPVGSGGFGAIHLADRGSLVLRHVEALEDTTQQALSRYLEDVAASGEAASPLVRILATTSGDLASPAASGRFDPRLAEQLAAAVIEMPRLADRRRDILPLANLFLNEGAQPDDGEAYEFTEAAKHALLSAQYRHNNATELREAVRFAPVFAEGPEIDAEHLFMGPKSEESDFDFNLGKIGLVDSFLRGGGLRVLRIATLIFFAAIAIVCLAASESALAKVANGLTWGLWWPALAVLFLAVGRVWCTVCPISTTGRLAKLAASPDRSPPKWMKEHTGWLTAFLFLLIVWSEYIFEMPARPFASGLLFLSLMAAAATLCVLYKREPWCRYLCPLGGLGAGYAVPGTLYVRANPNVCSTQCSTHECVKGSSTSGGCPVYIHPLYVRDGHLCKLCFECVRHCPHGSPKPFVRPPFRGIWGLADLSETLSPFSLSAFFLSIVMMASQQVHWIKGPGGFTGMAFVAVGLAFAFHSRLPRMLLRDPDSDPAMPSRVAFALLLLGWGPLMAFHLGHIPGLASLHIVLDEGSLLGGHLLVTKITVLSVLKLLAILIASISAFFSLWHVYVRARLQDAEFTSWGWRVVMGICVLYLLTALGLLL